MKNYLMKCLIAVIFLFAGCAAQTAALENCENHLNGCYAALGKKYNDTIESLQAKYTKKILQLQEITKTRKLHKKPPFSWDPDWCEDLSVSYLKENEYRPRQKTMCSWHIANPTSDASCLTTWKWDGDLWFSTDKYVCTGRPPRKQKSHGLNIRGLNKFDTGNSEPYKRHRQN
jgi:hypothetical protein